MLTRTDMDDMRIRYIENIPHMSGPLESQARKDIFALLDSYDEALAVVVAYGLQLDNAKEKLAAETARAEEAEGERDKWKDRTEKYDEVLNETVVRILENGQHDVIKADRDHWKERAEELERALKGCCNLLVKKTCEHSPANKHEMRLTEETP